MLKNYKGTLILTSVILLLPILAGLLLWNRLPEQVPCHWNTAGQIDGWQSKTFAVFFLPLFMLGIQWFCVLMTSLDPKNKDVRSKIIYLVLWILPVIGLLVNCLIYATALGYKLSPEILIPMLLGLLFLMLGNYMPKCKQNYTIGIRVPWTLNSEENWTHTHRFAGKVWVIGGAAMMLSSVLGSFIPFLAIALVISLLPPLYSYLYYNKHEKNL